MNFHIKKRLGEILIESGKITQTDLQKALEIQKSSGKKIGEILIDMNLIQEEDLTLNLSIQSHLPFIKIQDYQMSPDVLKVIPKGLAIKYKCIPIEKIGNVVSFVISDPSTIEILKSQEQFLNCTMQFFITTNSSLEKALKKHYGAL